MNSLELLQSYFKGEHLEFSGDVKEEIRNQNKQSLAPFLYFVYGQPFVKAYIGSTIIQERFYKLQDEITALFNENKIKHYYIKGSVLSKIYPDPALRTRGDIDVVVQECDYERARKVLEDNGYKYDEETEYHLAFLKNDLEVELHRRLLPKNDIFYETFKNSFEHSKLLNNYLYELNPSFHFIYVLAHFNKHLLEGEGLRTLLDFYYMSKAYDLDYDYIEKTLKQIGLFKLYQSVINALYVITSEKLNYYTGENVDKFICYMLNNGIHGKSDAENDCEKQILINGNSKIKYLFSRLFIGKGERELFYPKMSKCFLLFPFIYIHRFFSLLIKRNSMLKKTIKADTKKMQIDKNFYKEFGIIDSE